ncbi:MAG: thioredoxin family protein [Thermodesulfobacteriota bacterium]
MDHELQIRDTAPDFTLPGTDGKQHGLADYAEYKALVVIFTCNHCPYVKAYDDRIIALQDEFKERGVMFIGINSNEDRNYPEDSFDNMVKKAKEKGLNYPYLRDETQETAHAYGASHTPQIFVFDGGRKLRYKGKIDDNWRDPSGVRERFLSDALSELLEGGDVQNPETYAIGCTIKWQR